MNLAGVLRGRWRLAAASFRTSRDGRRGGGWRDLIVVGLFAGLSWFALARLFERLALDQVPAADAARVLGMALTAAFIGLSVFDLHQAVSALVLDSDLELLRAAPLTPRVLALLKLFDALPSTGVLTAMLVAPALLGYARAYPLPAWAGALLPLAVLALWLTPLAFGMSVALPLVRRLPALRVRESLAVIATASLMVLWLLQAFVLPRVTEQVAGLSAPLVALGRAWDHAFGVLLPPFWLTRALGAATAPGGDTLPLALAVGSLVLVALVGLALYLVVATHQLEPVLRALAESAAPGRNARGGGAAAFVPMRGVVRALLARDARLIRRDWAVLVDVVVACLLWVLVPLATLPLTQGLAPIAGPMLVSLAVGLGYEVAGRSVPFERRGLAWLKLSPQPPARWLFAKLSGAALFSLPILVFATVAITLALRPAPALLATALMVTLSALVSSMALGIWTGVRFGDPEWVNPRAMLRLRGRLIAAFGLVFQIIGWVVLLWLAAPPTGTPRPLLGLLAPVAAVTIAALALALTRRELERFEPVA